MLPLSALPSVRCPRCGARAGFDEPFDFFAVKAAKALDADDPRPVHQWAGRIVREKYPSLISWRPPRGPEQALYWGGCSTGRTGGYRLRHRGVVRCPACHFVGVHVLRWPADAFFQWSIRGTTLWAWGPEHARVLLHYLGALQRDPWRFPYYRRSLQKMPATILAARNRDLVTRKIRESLERAGEPTDAPRPPDTQPAAP